MTVQIVPTTMLQTTSAIPVHSVISDVVSPARLFEFARIRFDGALGMLRQPGLRKAPTALTAAITRGQIRSGINALDGVLVPGVSFQLRHRAASVIDRARESMALLDRYHDFVVPFGDTSKRITELPIGARAALCESIAELTSAVSLIR